MRNGQETVKILVAGSINTDLVATVDRMPAAGETLNGSSFAIHGGGKAANQAVAAARSGSTVALVGAVGRDDFGSARLADLARDGVDVRYVMVDTELFSGVALILVETSGENRIVCVPGAANAVTSAHLLAAFREIRPAWMLATNELPVDVLSQVFRAARDVGTPIIYNAAPEPTTGAALLDSVDILIANEVEAAALTGQDRSFDADVAIAQLLRRGIGAVVLTLGAQGAVLARAEGRMRVAPPQVEAVDTTGAGDTFAGAMVAALATGDPMERALRYAVHASALAVTKPGAQTAIPTRAEVESRWPECAQQARE